MKEGDSAICTMNPPIVPRDQVAQHLSVSTSTLLKIEKRGLVQAVRQDDIEGYGPSEIRRLWTILTFHRDLGINLAGIEVILRLRDQMLTTQSRLDRLAYALQESLEQPTGIDSDG